METWNAQHICCSIFRQKFPADALLIFGLNFCGNHTTTNDPGVHFKEFTPLPDWNAGPRYDDKARTGFGARTQKRPLVI